MAAYYRSQKYTQKDIGGGYTCQNRFLLQNKIMASAEVNFVPMTHYVYGKFQ